MHTTLLYLVASGGILCVLLALGVDPLFVTSIGALLAAGGVLLVARRRNQFARCRKSQQCRLGFSVHATTPDRWVCCRCRLRYDDGIAAGSVPADLDVDVLAGEPIAGVSLSLDRCPRCSHACCDPRMLRSLRAAFAEHSELGVDMWGPDADSDPLPGDDGRPLGPLIGEIIEQACKTWVREGLSTAELCGTIVSLQLAARVVVELGPIERWPGRTLHDIDRAIAAAAETLREMAVRDAADIAAQAEVGKRRRGEGQR